jgi:hypothetical protein
VLILFAQRIQLGLHARAPYTKSRADPKPI